MMALKIKGRRVRLRWAYLGLVVVLLVLDVIAAATKNHWWLAGVGLTAVMLVTLAVAAQLQSRPPILSIDFDDYRCPTCGSPDPSMYISRGMGCKDPFHSTGRECNG